MTTYAQIGIAPCGCVVAAHAEWSEKLANCQISQKEYEKDVRRSIREWMKMRLAIGRVELTGENIFKQCDDPNCAERKLQAKLDKADIAT